MEGIVILGESKDSPEINNVVTELCQTTRWSFVDWVTLFEDDGHFHLDGHFNFFLQMIINEYDLLVILSPIHNYYISQIIEDFIKQMTYIVELENKNGRTSRIKYIAGISCSKDAFIGHKFWNPVKSFSKDLGFEYIGDLQTYNLIDEKDKIAEFVKLLENTLNVKFLDN